MRVTTWGVLSETYTWLRYHSSHRDAQVFLQEFDALQETGTVRTVYPSSEMEPKIRQELLRFSDQDLSYVDAMTLVVARSTRDIGGIFAFDHHMSLSGLPVLPP